MDLVCDGLCLQSQLREVGKMRQENVSNRVRVFEKPVNSIITPWKYILNWRRNEIFSFIVFSLFHIY